MLVFGDGVKSYLSDGALTTSSDVAITEGSGLEADLNGHVFSLA